MHMTNTSVFDIIYDEMFNERFNHKLHASFFILTCQVALLCNRNQVTNKIIFRPEHGAIIHITVR